jgi:putative flippase GtrA
MFDTHNHFHAGRSVFSASKTLVLYGGAGAIGTAVHFMVLFATLGIAEPVLASTLGAISGGIVNYFLARQFVFSSTASHASSAPKFLTVAVFGIAINAVVIKTFVGVLPIAINQALASGTVLLVGFSLNRIWTFDDHRD